MIRVLQVVTQMNRAGLESRLMDIYRAIDKTKVQFDFYTCRHTEGQFDAEIKAMGGTIYYTDPITVRNYLLVPNRIERFLKEQPRYQIVHCHLNQWCDTVLAGAKRAGVPVRIAHSRTGGFPRSSMTLTEVARDIVKQPIHHAATHRFAVSREAGLWLFGKKAIERGEVEIWPNAIDCRKFRYDAGIRQKMRTEMQLDDALVIMHAGRLHPAKNHKFLLQVFCAIKRKEPRAQLLLLGEGPLHDTLEGWIGENGMEDSVRLLGSRPNVAAYLQAADVFVFPSLVEGFPGAVLEAEAAGLPCLISDTITPEVCLVEGCKVLSLRSPAEEWAASALALAAMPRTDTYEQLVGKGYDISAVSKKYEQFYLTCTQQSGAV